MSNPELTKINPPTLIKTDFLDMQNPIKEKNETSKNNSKNPENELESICKQLRYNILRSTTEAETGHPTSSLSTVELMAQMMFGGYFSAELDNPHNINNDRLIFSKGHACPLLYSIYYTLGHVSQKELMSLRKFGSVLEGHPTMKWGFTEAATGSLGQGLGVAVGMALSIQKDFEHQEAYPNVWCLLGDSEIAEGSVWEAMNFANYYKLNNLIAIVDLNRLGQRGETQIGHKAKVLEAKVKAFGWEVFVVDGHDLESIKQVYDQITASVTDIPKMVIAKTYKGNGISFLQDKEGWHGKALSQTECKKALLELGEVDLDLRASIGHPKTYLPNNLNSSKQISKLEYSNDVKIATRKAYGNALNNLGRNNSQVVVLDAEMSNSTFSEIFAKNYPERFFECLLLSKI
jgi:transketolase